MLLATTGSSSLDPFERAEQLAQSNRKVRVDDRQHVADVVEMMSMASGRRVMWRFLGGLDVLASSFNTDHAVMARAEGKRESARSLYLLLQKHCPNLYLTMLDEHEALQ